jgi:hypothetical protein
MVGASLSSNQEKALLLWLNSSLSLLLYFGHRVVTRSAWMQMKQPAWESMPVLDVRALSVQQLTKLASRYDALSTENLSHKCIPTRCGARLTLQSRMRLIFQTWLSYGSFWTENRD